LMVPPRPPDRTGLLGVFRLNRIERAMKVFVARSRWQYYIS
jgi:hypothetical protein